MDIHAARTEKLFLLIPIIAIKVFLRWMSEKRVKKERAFRAVSLA